MRWTVFSVLGMALVAGSAGCHPLHRQPQGPDGCAGGACDVRGPYVFDEGAACQVGGQYVCADGSACQQGPGARGALEAIGRLFRHHRPEAPEGGPPVGTVTYPYYTVRGPRDFLASDPPRIGP